MHDLIKNNKIIKSKEFGRETPPILNAKKNMSWLPRVVINPDYDQATQIKTLEKRITATESIYEFVVRDKTAEELHDSRLHAWIELMEDSDKEMSRVQEDFLGHLENTHAESIPLELQNKRTVKRELREQKPA